MSSPIPSRRAARVMRVAAALILSTLVVDLVLTASGVKVLCKSCGEADGHIELLLLGLGAWGGFLLLERFVSSTSLTATLAGALAGAHVGLTTLLLAFPRWCTTCVTACTLSIVVLAASLANRDRDVRARPLAGVAFACAILGVHVVI